jgi:predicted transcriptional regulator
VQTTVYRLERKAAVRCVKRISNANIFESAMSRADAQGRLVDDIIGLLGGEVTPVMARLIETGKLTLDHIREAEETLRKLSRKGRKQ